MTTKAELIQAARTMGSVEVPLRYTEQPVFRSETGYGAKIPTRCMVYYLRRWRRVYCTRYSNNGSLWIAVGGVRVYVRDIFHGDTTAFLRTN